MKHLNIPFQIGQEYENWEFDLEVLPDRIKGYDSYLYVGKEFNYFLNYCTDKPELIFYWDRLEGVILEIKLDLVEAIILNNRLTHEFKHENIEYRCLFNLYTDTVIILYGTPRVIKH